MKSLLVYYSRTGTTKKVAEAISELIDCDVEEILDERGRSGILGFLNSAIESIRKKPASIKKVNKEPSKYDVVIIGTPTWTGNISSPVRAYLEQKNDKIQNVALFCTYAGRSFGRSLKEMEDILEKRPVAQLHLRQRDVNNGSGLLDIKSFADTICGEIAVDSDTKDAPIKKKKTKKEVLSAESLLDKNLREIIPDKYSTFPKLEKGDPYHFDHWGKDTNGEDCLYYWFWNKDQTKKNRKRVVILEIDNLIKNKISNGHISREDFKRLCPISESAGSCGYTVVGRILEYLEIAKYLGRGSGFEITDHKLAESLIKEA
ncbi:MAG: hypothetical protein SVJ22_06170 [Halobacteriota archaeon]|nr:hypothetical protein [Halobacteriota archaeon]